MTPHLNMICNLNATIRTTRRTWNLIWTVHPFEPMLEASPNSKNLLRTVTFLYCSTAVSQYARTFQTSSFYDFRMKTWFSFSHGFQAAESWTMLRTPHHQPIAIPISMTATCRLQDKDYTKLNMLG